LQCQRTGNRDALRRAKERNIPVLIEATANQVNQFGGYTGMKPADFYQMVLKMASDIGLPENMMILAGDHLGPLTWQKLPESEAMENSVELVYQYARAGFTKIHLDTSMKVADDRKVCSRPRSSLAVAQSCTRLL
jgi:D-tagatose-1,6-bisphosphate aldolase subunit GatZ/KbaZ